MRNWGIHLRLKKQKTQKQTVPRVGAQQLKYPHAVREGIAIFYVGTGETILEPISRITEWLLSNDVEGWLRSFAEVDIGSDAPVYSF